MNRRAHYIKDNKTSEYPQQCVWFDCETHFTSEDIVPGKESDVIWYETQKEFDASGATTQYHWLKFGYACYMRRHRDGIWSDEQWLRFVSVDEFWSWVCSKARDKTKLYLLCHNTSFDLPVLNVFQELPRRGYSLRSAIIDAPPTILRFRNATKCIMILDTLNIWRMPLKYLGEEIGLPKLEMPDNNDLAVEWETYAKRDVEILKAACIKWWSFLEQNDMGSFAPTLAGQSMRVYRHKYMDHRIFVDNDTNALELTREGYYGGRVECFKIGSFRGPFHLLDVNSMYPYVMATNAFPSKLVSHTYRATVQDIRLWLQRYSVTARVRIRTSKPFAAVRDNHKLIFPIGEFDCILSTPELEYALLYAEILAVHQVALYQRQWLFTRMVYDLYQRKQDAKRRGDAVEEFMYKKLLNSFYGKWGQSGGKWKEDENITDLSCKRWIDIDYETKKITSYRQLGGLRQVKDENTESRDSFPAIAAHITAYARMYLWKIIETVGVTNAYYVDTDCILTNSSGVRSLQYLQDDYRLGALKVAGEYDDIQIWGAKDYRFGSKEKHKGVRKTASWIDSHTISQSKWSGMRGLVSSGVINRPLTQTITKHLSRLYEKGIVLADGTVLPFELPH